MQGSLIITPAEFGEGFKKDLVAEISKTPLGKNLLGWMAANGIDIEITTDMSAVQGTGSKALGYWNPKAKKLFLNPIDGIYPLMHVFAHELRHAAQDSVYESLERGFDRMAPVNYVLERRLREMDADAFAVFFVAQHLFSTETKDDSILSQRPEMYDAFAEADGDDAERLQAAVKAYLEDKDLATAYGTYALKSWEHSMAYVLVYNLDKPESDFSKAFKKAAARFNDGAFEEPLERLQRFMLGYSKLFTEQGAPDYLTPDAARDIGEKLAGTGGGEKLEEAQEKFRNLAARYAPALKAPGHG